MQIDLSNAAKDIRYVTDAAEGYLAIKQGSSSVIVPIEDITAIAGILKAERNEVAAAGRKASQIARFGLQSSLFERGKK